MHISALAIHFCWSWQVAAVIILQDASLHVNAFIWENILVLYLLIQEHVKEGYAVHFITATFTLFIFSTLVPTCLGFEYLCFYRKESWRILHMHLIFKVHIDDCHHGWVMIVEWSFIHFWLVILEGWNIPHEFQLVAILLDVYGMSFMFWLVLVDCVGWLVSHLLIPLRWRKTLCSLMKHKMR